MSRQIDLGAVTPYGVARDEAGYAGTKQQFADGLRASAEYATNAQQSATAAAAAQTAAEAAQTAAETAQAAAEGAQDAAEDARDDAAASAAQAAQNAALYDEVASSLANLQSYFGFAEGVLGLEVDYANQTFTRLADAVGKTAGADFNVYSMYGGRKRCNVADDGTINAYYGDIGYADDGSNGQVMVYQPKFYYLVTPVKTEPISTRLGYHLRKANYYISAEPRPGFKLHPAFFDKNGSEVDYVLLGAYEACLFDVSANAYITNDAQVMDATADKLSSIADVKPASGSTQSLNRTNVEALAQNRGTDWHGSTIQTISMNQLLCMIELGTMNFQTAVGLGVCDYGSGTGNEASNTGATASLGNGTGEATSTTHVSSEGTTTIETTTGKLSVSYHGLENPWGNIYELTQGVNLWGDGLMAGGEPYICADFDFEESKKGDNYAGAGFTVANDNGYISAMAYSADCDWLFFASEVLGNNALPVGDYVEVISNLNGYSGVRIGGYWNQKASSGGFCTVLTISTTRRARYWGGRLIYVPTATV